MEVRRATPWRAKENDIRSSSGLPPSDSFRELDEISKYKLDPISNTVDGCIVSRESQPRLVIVYCDNALARFGKRDCVAAHPTKRVYDSVTPTPFRDLVCDKFRGDAVPPNAIQETALIIEGEVSAPLKEIWVNDIMHVRFCDLGRGATGDTYTS